MFDYTNSARNVPTSHNDHHHHSSNIVIPPVSHFKLNATQLIKLNRLSRQSRHSSCQNIR